jgi:hypothetical protein
MRIEDPVLFLGINVSGMVDFYPFFILQVEDLNGLNRTSFGKAKVFQDQYGLLPSGAIEYGFSFENVITAKPW